MTEIHISRQGADVRCLNPLEQNMNIIEWLKPGQKPTKNGIAVISGALNKVVICLNGRVITEINTQEHF